MTTDEYAAEFVKHLLGHPYWLSDLKASNTIDESGKHVLELKVTYIMHVPWDDLAMANGYMLEKLIDTYGKPAKVVDGEKEPLP